MRPSCGSILAQARWCFALNGLLLFVYVSVARVCIDRALSVCVSVHACGWEVGDSVVWFPDNSSNALDNIARVFCVRSYRQCLYIYWGFVGTLCSSHR